MRNQTTVRDFRCIQPKLKCLQMAAFSLVELLAIIAVIGILAALMLPALGKARSRVQTLACLNNLKQLETSCHLYSSDYSDYLPPNEAIKTVPKPGLTNAMVSVLNANSWCPGIAPSDLTPNNVQQGLIFPYNRSPFIYRCPTDNSTVNGFPGLLRTRSFAMDVSLNSDESATTFRKFTDIHAVGPASLFVLVDDQEQDIWDATFNLTSADGTYADYWINLPADRHNQGANLSFADGHVEYWKWAAPKVCMGNPAPAYSEADLTDLRRLQQHAKPDVN